MTQLLVAFASKHGSTTEIAEALAEELRSRGYDVDLAAARDVRDVTPYGAVVIGSAVYMGHWLKDAINLVKHNERDLRERPTWLFSSGPTGGSPDSDAAVIETLANPTAKVPINEVADRFRRIGARGHVTFPGRVSEEANGLLERWMPRGDWRDFGAIKAWAGDIASELQNGIRPPLGRYGGPAGPHGDYEG
jgi:menaquinone-dependent protoporphyrinogen oxidase